MTAKLKYHKRRNVANRANLNKQCKLYKRTMNKYIAKYRKEQENKLRNLEKQNPKMYWRYLNSLRNNKKETMPSASCFFEYFKNLDTENSTESNDIFEDDFSIEDDNEILNSEILEQEILQCVRSLKNGKAAGDDKIINEYIKTTVHIFMPIYLKLFNKVLNSGCIPDEWLQGIIKPVFKNKGDAEKPENYRPITILSCLSKLFTSILNLRLTKYLETNEILNENQAGFRKDYSTVDHIFVLNSLVEFLRSQKKKLFCAFIDFSQAFDNVWRIGLWRKLLQNDVKGKFFRVIYNMYSEIKSCVSAKNDISGFFISNIGVRQGENLSPILFSIYLNDLEGFLEQNRNFGIPVECLTEELYFFLKIGVLLYADDTVFLAENENDLQICLDLFNEYCRIWKLKVNHSKTKVVIFGARNTSRFSFKLGESFIEITENYKYLGIYFSKSGSFLSAKKNIVEQAKKAMHLLFVRVNNLNLPIDLQLKLFDNTVLPILTYACEVWGYEDNKIIERVHTEFLRKITKTRKSTPMYMLYGELGRYPIQITIDVRMIKFWNKIVVGKQSKLSFVCYKVLWQTLNRRSKWINYIQGILEKTGKTNIWIKQDRLNNKCVHKTIKQTLLDNFHQNWNSDTNESSKGKQYRLFKSNTSIEKYLTVLPKTRYISLIKFRTANHRFPIETGRWENIDISERKCLKCNDNRLGDEFHYLFECPVFKSERLKFLEEYYYKRPNVIKFNKLMNSDDPQVLIKLSIFVNTIMKAFSN